jgi:hypothetical protein
MIKPTVGRIVHYFAGDQLPDKPFAAIITHVWSDCRINVTVFAQDGHSYGLGRVFLSQPGEEIPRGDYCAWMPYQQKKSFGSESGEKEAGVEKI